MTTYSVREGDIVTQKDANWEGSLGFLVDEGYVISNKHVLPDVGATVVHRRQQWGDAKEIGVVVRVSQWTRPSFFDYLLLLFGIRPKNVNKTDAALVALNPSVEVKRFMEIEGFSDPTIGSKLYKRGRTTGETTGVVLSTDDTIIVNVGDKPIIFTDVFKFSNTTKAGDSGGPCVSEVSGKLYAVGITFAGPQDGSYGYGIKINNIRAEFRLK
ncbi:MAG: S1 family peptidase [Thaumarchaeota archaeon]|nr:S1 family peptidase [Candidatus Calditenuaceae archaeon]